MAEPETPSPAPSTATPATPAAGAAAAADSEVASLVREILQLKQELDDANVNQEEITKRYTEALAGLLNDKEEFDPSRWSSVPQEEKAPREIKLRKLKQTLTNAITAAEPVVRIPPDSYMYKKQASNDAIRVLTGIAFLGLILNLWLIKANWTKATSGVDEKSCASATATPAPTATSTPTPTSTAGLISVTPAAAASASTTTTPTPTQTTATTESASAKPPEGPPAKSSRTTMSPLGKEDKNEKPVGPLEGDVLYMVMLLGALGGFLRLASSLANYVGNRQLLKSWIIYYLLTPIQGAALAPLIYLLLRVGVLNPATTPGSSSPAASLNLIGIYAFAGLTGLFSKQAMEMLADVFSTIFKKSETKDALDKSKETKTKPADSNPAA